MSIEKILKDRVQRGMVHLLKPVARGASIRRILLIGERLHKALEEETGDAKWDERIGWLKADLEVFVTSKNLRPEYLFWLYPRSKCIWEIRSVQNEPSVRVFGLFAAKDVFLATNFALRGYLGEWESREWKREKRNATVEWNGLMHPYKPVQAVTVHDVVTGAINAKYFK